MFAHGTLLRKVHERALPYGLTAADRLLLTVPLSNVWGMANGLFFAFVHGASPVLQETFVPEETLDLLARHRCTLYAGVPSMFTDVLDHPRFADYDLSALRIANVSAATVPRDLMEAVRTRLQVEHIVTSYGLSEACGTLTAAYPGDPFESRCRTVGQRVPTVEVEIVDPDTREVLPPGTPGAICARGYSIMPGYYRDQEATAQVIDTAGWLHTGDRDMFTEDGYLVFLGRIKDMYKRAGYNVYTQDVEECLLEHAAVQEVAVTGVPDTRMGEEGDDARYPGDVCLDRCFSLQRPHKHALIGLDHRVGHFRPPKTIAEVARYLISFVLKHFGLGKKAHRVAGPMIEAL